MKSAINTPRRPRKSGSPNSIDAVQALIMFLEDMDREGRIMYVDAANGYAFMKVAEHLVEVTEQNSHLFPKPAVSIPITVRVIKDDISSRSTRPSEPATTDLLGPLEKMAL